MSRRTRSISATKGLLAFVGSGQRRAVAGDPADVVDVGDRPDLAYNLLDVRQARRLEREPAQGRSVLDGIHPRREDVHPRIRDGRGDVLQEAHPVQRLDEQLHREEPPGGLRPLDLDKTIRVARLEGPGVRAARRVHHDAPSQRDVAYDVVSGHGTTAAGQACEYPARAYDPHPRTRAVAAARSRLLLFFPPGLDFLHSPMG